MATYIQEGDEINYTPAGAVAAGDVVVQGDLVGVAKLPIASAELGALAINGVFDFPKRVASIDAGTKLYWKAASAVAQPTAASGTYIGKSIESAVGADAVISIRLDQ